MKFLTIGDIHGRDNWKVVRDHYNLDEYEKIVFIGDYVDSFDKRDTEILKNLEEIIEFKTWYPDKVVLLKGNHDVMYMEYPRENCSGLRVSMVHALRAIFSDNSDLFQLAYQNKNYLWTHAGMSVSWMNWCVKRGMDFKGMLQNYFNYADILNEMEKGNWKTELYVAGKYNGGFDPLGGVIWARKPEIINNIPEGLHQIVGHTPCKDIETYTVNENTSITYVDVLEQGTIFYEHDI